MSDVAKPRESGVSIRDELADVIWTAGDASYGEIYDGTHLADAILEMPPEDRYRIGRYLVQSAIDAGYRAA
ncbi:hypothetical protein [Nocardia otitidiscaviarum]|uniref:hypothetical protein n=1 Tax=Nocardia otitidiscaviarum TaxID=1823 RepID=UPI0004A71494|nr:hypothetical protein [Nocardia otitidiscaviarum]